MSEEAGKFAELKVKHLEMVQAIVARMSNHSAAIKNYCITVTTAVAGFAITLHRPAMALLALLPIISFGLLDAQYLRLERRFRGLFEYVRQEDWGKPPSFEISLHSAPPVGYWSTLRSWSILSFYGPLAIAVLVVVLAAGYFNGWTL